MAQLGEKKKRENGRVNVPIGMHSGCDYSYKPCLCTFSFWHSFPT